MNMLFHFMTKILTNQNQPILNYHLNLIKYFQASNPYKLFYSNEDKTLIHIFKGNIILHHFLINILIILDE